jgi:hypothetical protein
MKTHKSHEMNDDLRPEYDMKALLKKAKPNPYAKRYAEGTNLVLLAPDVAEAFPDAESVNEALRLVIELTKLPNGRRHRATTLSTRKG